MTVNEFTTPLDAAQSVLAALGDAADAEPALEVGRRVIAPGPDFARDCGMLAVHLGFGGDKRLDTSGRFPVECFGQSEVVVWAHYVSDCVPVSDDSGTPPPADDITDYSETFYANVWRFHAALLTWRAESGGDATVEQFEIRGPGGRFVSARWRITVPLDAVAFGP